MSSSVRQGIGRGSMRPRGYLLALAILVALTACAPRSDRISQAWFDQWIERKATYRAEAVRRLVASEARKADVREIALSDPSGDDLNNGLLEYFEAASDTAEAVARYGLLYSFLDYWEGAPTPGMVATWLEDKARGINEDFRSWETEKAALLSREPGIDNIGAVYDLKTGAGVIIGMGDEILRLSRETEVYLAELGVAEQADALALQAFAAGMQQMGQAMQRASDRQREIGFQNQLLHELRRSRQTPALSPTLRLRTTCQQIGTMTFCN